MMSSLALSQCQQFPTRLYARGGGALRCWLCVCVRRHWHGWWVIIAGRPLHVKRAAVPGAAWQRVVVTAETGTHDIHTNMLIHV